MAVNVSAWVWTLQLTPYEKIVMLELADHADVSGYCFPKQGTIAKRTGCSRQTVNKVIKRMESYGYIEQEHQWIGHRRTASKYRLTLNASIHLSSAGLPFKVNEGDFKESPKVTAIETSIETSKESSLASSPTLEEIPIKISDVIETNSKTKKSIFEKFKPTPKGCGDLWRDCRATASDENGFAAELLVKDFKMLDNARKRVGDVFPEVVWKVCSDWVKFKKFAEAHHGAFGMGLKPSVKKFVLYIEAAADHCAKAPVKSIAQPLTKQPAPCKPIPKVTVQTEPSETMAEKFARQKKEREEKKAAYLANMAEETNSE